MKIANIPDLGLWVVADYSSGEDSLPQLYAFKTRDEAREFKSGNAPSLLDKVKIYFEGIRR